MVEGFWRFIGKERYQCMLFFVGAFLLSESVYAQVLPYCPIYGKPTRTDYEWYGCEGIPGDFCSFYVGCHMSGSQCVGEFLYPSAFGVPDCESISSQSICRHRMGCEWGGGVCQNSVSSPACIPVTPLDANLRFEALKDGSYACIFTAKTKRYSDLEAGIKEPTFDPFTMDGVNFDLVLSTPLADGRSSSQHFRGPANVLSGSKQYEFYKVMTAEEVSTIRMSSVFQTGGRDQAPKCSASFGVPEQSSGVLIQPLGGGLQCECPEEFMKMLESYNLGGLYEFYDHLATANAVSNVSDTCAPIEWRRLSQLPISMSETGLVSSLFPYSCFRDIDPTLIDRVPYDWNTCFSFNPSSPSQRFVSRSATWLRACFDRRTQPQIEYGDLQRDDEGGWYREAVAVDSKPSFASEFEKDLGVFHFQYLMKQVEVTQGVNEEHLRVARRIIQTMEVEPPMFAATSFNRYIPAESLATAQQVYQRIQIAETIWSLLPGTQWDHFQHDLNQAELMAYLESPANPVVAATAHWPQHPVPSWKLIFFEQSCEGGFYCGLDVDPRASFSVLVAKLLQMMKAEEDAVEQVKLQLPWMAGVVDEIVNRARRDLSGSTYVNGVFIKSPYPPNLVGAPPTEDWYKSRLKAPILSFYRAQLPELERLQANLVKMKASLTCSTPANRLSPSEFDATMRTLIDVPAKSRESYRKCYARDQIWNVSEQTMEPVCKTYEGRAADGDYCYCEGSGLATIDPDMTRQVTRDQIEWRITATDKILSQRNWAKDLSEINGMIKATGWMALTTIFAPGAFQIGISALARAGTAVVQLSKAGMAGALSSELRGLAYFGDQAWQTYKLVRMGKEPAIQLLAAMGYAFDAAAYISAGSAVYGKLSGHCEAKYLAGPELGDSSPANSHFQQTVADKSLEDYFNCIRAQMYAVTALRFTGVVDKFTKVKVSEFFKKPANPELAAESAVAKFRAERETQIARLKSTTSSTNARVNLTTEIVNQGTWAALVPNLEGKVIEFGNGHSFLLGKKLGRGQTTYIYELADYPLLAIRIPADRAYLGFINDTLDGVKAIVEHGVHAVRVHGGVKDQYVIVDRVFSGTDKSIDLSQYVWRLPEIQAKPEMLPALGPFIKSTRDFAKIGDFKLSQILWDDIEKRWVLTDWAEDHVLLAPEKLQCFSETGRDPAQFQFIKTLDLILAQTPDAYGIRDLALKVLK